EGLVGEMGQRIREKIKGGGYNEALLTGVRVFVDRLGEINNFDFASLDPKRGETIAQAQRPRTIQSPISEPSVKPQPTPAAADSATPRSEATATPTASVEARVEASPNVSPVAESTPSA